MIIKAPTSIGDLIDRLSILEIKKERINNLDKIKYVNVELKSLQTILNEENIDLKKIKNLYTEISNINSKLWQIEDRIRECERNKDFGDNFIELARSVYINNDIRAKIKSKINKEFGSKIMEVKSYKEY